MPDYEYECAQCKQRFVLHESLREHSSKSRKTKCPNCGSLQVERIFTDVYVRTSRKA